MTRARSQDLARLAVLVDSGRLMPTVERCYCLDDAAVAHQHAEKSVRGKVVLRLAS